MKRVINLNQRDCQETTEIGNEIYSTKELWSRVENEEAFDIHLAAIDYSRKPWSTIGSLYEFCYHYARCEDADMNYPILLSPEGGILDGNHRVCKAIIEGKKTIKAKQLPSFPEYIEKKEE